MKLLLTAFDPFGGEPVNPAQEAVRLVRAPAGMTLIKCTVPTVYGRSIETVSAVMDAQQPDIVLCIGQAAGRKALTPESRAVNVCEASCPDNDGKILHGVPVIPGAPEEYFSTLPYDAMAAAICAVGLPAEVSGSAGTFVCNHLLFGVLHKCAEEHRLHPDNKPVRAGFLHVPCIPEQLARMPAGTFALPTEEIARGITAALTALLKITAVSGVFLSDAY